MMVYGKIGSVKSREERHLFTQLGVYIYIYIGRPLILYIIINFILPYL